VVSGDYAYVACGHSGLRVIDVSSPTNPTEVGAYGVLDYAWAVVVAGNYAYIADEEAGLCIINITNPRNPVFVGVCDTPGGAMGVAVSGDYAYVADLHGGLRVIDASNISTTARASRNGRHPANHASRPPPPSSATCFSFRRPALSAKRQAFSWISPAARCSTSHPARMT
jgi:hypothetical protein